MHDSERASHSRRPRYVVPSRNDPFLKGLTEVAGGPLGRRCAPGIIVPGFFTVERVLLLLVMATGIAAVLFKDHCQRSGWTTPDQYTTVCYSEIPNVYKDKGLAAFFPYFSQSPALDHPPLTGWIAGITAWLAGVAGGPAAQQLAFFDLNAGLLVAAWGAAALAVSRSCRRRPWDGAIVAASPLLAFAALAGWELWPAAFLALAVAAIHRGRNMWAGVFTGLAFSAEPYAALLLVAVALLAIRDREAMPWWETVGGALLGWAVVTLPILVLHPGNYAAYWSRLPGAQPSQGSLYGVYNILAARLGHEQLGNTGAFAISCVLLAGAVAGIGLFALRSARRPTPAQLLLLLVGVYWLVSTTASPQQLVWLLPVIAVARPRWRSILGWQAAAVLGFLAWQLYLGRQLGNLDPQHSIDLPYFVLAMGLCMAATLVLMFLVSRDIVRKLPVARPVALEAGLSPSQEK